MTMKKSKLTTLAVIFASCSALASQAISDTNYGPFPITVKGYTGTKTNSVSYTGQMARHVLHDSLKKLASTGSGEANPALEEEMMAYFSGSKKNKAIISPVSILSPWVLMIEELCL